MKIINIFDAVREGTYEEFLSFYKGNPNEYSETLGLNLLHLSLVNDKLPDEKIKIIAFLIKEGADLNWIDKKNKRNALHQFYFSVMRPTPEYMFEITKILTENNIDVNCQDKFGAIPLKYSLTIVKLPTIEIKNTYEHLLKVGSDYNIKDNFCKSCLDYAKEYSWRNDFLEIVKELQATKL